MRRCGENAQTGLPGIYRNYFNKNPLRNGPGKTLSFFIKSENVF
jgi:hypothetical protein